VKDTLPDPWEEIRNVLDVGDVINVAVSNIEPYGVFVDLGNDVEGFLHVSEISWDKKPKHPKNYLKVGQKLDVEVIEIDLENKRLRVSLKKLLPKPFEEFLKEFKEGDIVEGEISSVTDFGAFVKIKNIEGLLHNKDVDWKGSKAKDVLKAGDKVKVKIDKIDKENEKISLNRKELLESPIEKFAKSYKVGDKIEGKIKDIKDFGIFVEINEDVDILIRNEDIAPLKKENLKVGDRIEAVLILVDIKKKRVRASVKKLAKMKEKEAIKEVNKGSNKITIGEIIKEKMG
jgi:small subunit ribosomal protein S1